MASSMEKQAIAIGKFVVGEHEFIASIGNIRISRNVASKHMTVMAGIEKLTVFNMYIV